MKRAASITEHCVITLAISLDKQQMLFVKKHFQFKSCKANEAYETANSNIL